MKTVWKLINKQPLRADLIVDIIPVEKEYDSIIRVVVSNFTTKVYNLKMIDTNIPFSEIRTFLEYLESKYYTFEEYKKSKNIPK